MTTVTLTSINISLEDVLDLTLLCSMSKAFLAQNCARAGRIWISLFIQ